MGKKFRDGGSYSQASGQGRLGREELQHEPLQVCRDHPLPLGEIMEEGKLIITEGGTYKVPSLSQCLTAVVGTTKSNPSTNSVGEHLLEFRSPF